MYIFSLRGGQEQGGQAQEPHSPGERDWSEIGNIKDLWTSKLIGFGALGTWTWECFTTKDYMETNNMIWSKIFVKGRKAWDIFRFRLPYIWCGSLKPLNGWEVVSFSNDMKREREREMIFSRIESEHCSHPPKKRTSDFPPVIAVLLVTLWWKIHH